MTNTVQAREDGPYKRLSAVFTISQKLVRTAFQTAFRRLGGVIGNQTAAMIGRIVYYAELLTLEVLAVDCERGLKRLPSGRITISEDDT